MFVKTVGLPSAAEAVPDAREPLTRLMRDLRTSADGPSEREVARRPERYGPNERSTREGRTWPQALARPFTHPLADRVWPG